LASLRYFPLSGQMWM